MIEATDWAMALLRIVAGAVILAHGIKHARGKQKTSAWFASIGFRAPDMQWMASTVTEIGVGLLLILGLGASLAGAGLAAVMAVAFWTVHRAAGFWVTARPDEGWEYVLILGTVGATVSIAGAGAFSIDALIGLDTLLNGWVGAGIVAGGLVFAVLQLVTFFHPEDVATS